MIGTNSECNTLPKNRKQDRHGILDDNPFLLREPLQKLKVWQEAAQRAHTSPENFRIPDRPARNCKVLHPKYHPPKLGFASTEGRARTIHDLANIELQAMELAFRTLVEYPDAPAEFRRELLDLTLNEGEHFELCLNTLEELGFAWGHWPVHLSLWDAVSANDTLLERIVLVHRYLEGSGLDAGTTLLKRLVGVGDQLCLSTVKRINDEELFHVQMGSRWFRQICNSRNTDADVEFKKTLFGLLGRLPKRIEPLHLELRRKALFSENELKTCEELRQFFLKPKELREQEPLTRN